MMKERARVELPVRTNPGSACHLHKVEVNFYPKAIILIIENERPQYNIM